MPVECRSFQPQAIVADIAESDCIETGENHDAMFYAARTFAFKMGQSIAMIIFTSLAVIGQYKEVTEAGETVIRNNGTGYRVGLIIALLLCIIAMLIIRFYREDIVMDVINENHKQLEDKDGE